MSKGQQYSKISSDNLPIASSSSSHTDSGSLKPPYYADGRQILLQVFDWETHSKYRDKLYQRLEKRLTVIKNAGFTAVWMPPPWRDGYRPPGFKSGDSYGSGYGWMDFIKDSAYGTDTELKNIAKKLNDEGIKVIYDLVINHRNMTRDEEIKGIWKEIPKEDQKVDPAVKIAQKLHMFGQKGSDLSDLNLTHYRVFNAFVDEIVNLILNYHAKGFRFDFAMGYTPQIVRHLIKAAEEKIKDRGGIFPDLFLVAEYPEYEFKNQQELVNWSIQDGERSILTFDFPGQTEARKEDITNKNIEKRLNKNWPEIAVPFVGNHDTDERSQNPEKPVPQKLRPLNYVYILLTPGTPCVMWLHWHIWGKLDGLKDLVKDLIKIRKEAEIHASSKMTLLENPKESGALMKVKGDKGEVIIGIRNFSVKQEWKPELKVDSNSGKKFVILNPTSSEWGFFIGCQNEIFKNLGDKLTSFKPLNSGESNNSQQKEPISSSDYKVTSLSSNTSSSTQEVSSVPTEETKQLAPLQNRLDSTSKHGELKEMQSVAKAEAQIKDTFAVTVTDLALYQKYTFTLERIGNENLAIHFTTPTTAITQAEQETMQKRLMKLYTQLSSTSLTLAVNHEQYHTQPNWTLSIAAEKPRLDNITQLLQDSDHPSLLPIPVSQQSSAIFYESSRTAGKMKAREDIITCKIQ